MSFMSAFSPFHDRQGGRVGFLGSGESTSHRMLVDPPGLKGRLHMLRLSRLELGSDGHLLFSGES